MCDIFETRNLNYNLRSQTDFARTGVNTSSFGLNPLKYLATKILDIIPCDIKSTGNLNSFKEKIRNWEPKGSHCKLSRAKSLQAKPLSCSDRSIAWQCKSVYRFLKLGVSVLKVF